MVCWWAANRSLAARFNLGSVEWAIALFRRSNVDIPALVSKFTALEDVVLVIAINR